MVAFNDNPNPPAIWLKLNLKLITDTQQIDVAKKYARAVATKYSITGINYTPGVITVNVNEDTQVG